MGFFNLLSIDTAKLNFQRNFFPKLYLFIFACSRLQRLHETIIPESFDTVS